MIACGPTFPQECSCIVFVHNRTSSVNYECCRYANACENLDWGCTHEHSYTTVDDSVCQTLGLVQPATVSLEAIDLVDSNES